MVNKDLLFNLRKQLEDSILPLINSDYVLWGLPYYINPGDTLIWEGALDLLKGCNYKCIDTCGWNDYSYRPLNKDTVILIIGGGFFGDVWRNAWEPVVNTVTKYPDNKIIILPQSIYYSSTEFALSDAKKLALCNDLTIFVRDQKSYDFAVGLFTNTIKLVPDLAFHFPISKLRDYDSRHNRVLYVKRVDKEKPIRDLKEIESLKNVDIRDWPDMSGSYDWNLRIIMAIYNRISSISFAPHISRWIIEKLMYYFFRTTITKNAIDFINQYDTIYTTRLHVMILSFLLDKEVFILDNSYGKVSGCYLAWLRECKKIQIYE